jgi:hypothetical protein
MQEVIPVNRKNPYSQINVNEISIEALARGRAGQKAAVGMDVGKAELTLCLVNGPTPRSEQQVGAAPGESVQGRRRIGLNASENESLIGTEVGEQRRSQKQSVADSITAQGSHWNKVVGIPRLFRLDRAETGDVALFEQGKELRHLLVGKTFRILSDSCGWCVHSPSRSCHFTC